MTILPPESTTNKPNLCGLDAHLLRCFSADLDEIGQGQAFGVREQPREVGIVKFQMAAMEIWKNFLLKAHILALWT